MGTPEIVGVYRITPAIESIVSAARYHSCDYLLDEHGDFKDDIRWDSFKNLALLEILIQGKFSPEEMTSIGQDDQAAYMEFYLDGTGTRLMSEDEARQSDNRRVCFFLHFLDTAKPITVGREQMKIQTVSALPERLKPYTHYLPVD
ncbi:MAG: hypothetical protein ACM3S0_00495 [Acidobacteriota bacterium]